MKQDFKDVSMFRVDKGFRLSDGTFVRRDALFRAIPATCKKHKKCQCLSNGKLTPTVTLVGSTPGGKKRSLQRSINIVIEGTLEHVGADFLEPLFNQGYISYIY